MNIINKKGMTLLELLVYLALAALLLAPVVMLIHNSSLNMARDTKKTDMHISGRDILNIMYDDLKNTGFKIIDINIGVENAVMIAPALAAPNTDISSFIAGNCLSGCAHDSITIIRGVLSNIGAWNGYNRVAYSVDADRQLIRTASFMTVAGDALDTTLVIARNIEALQFRYSADLVNWVDEPAVLAKGNVKFIKIFLVLQDNSRAGAVKNPPSFTIADHTVPAAGAPVLRERYEIVVPVPNNGLVPPIP
ncbi:MAG: PilW family protein [Chitinispirillales bacterium]|jgi:hypothetical protein|nr:PilW family protein [Chitinispirillales bacterium]